MKNKGGKIHALLIATFFCVIFLLPIKNMALDENNTLSLGSEQTDQLNFKHQLYNQKYNNILVFGGQTISHYNNSKLTSTSGDIITNINLDTTPQISEAQAITKALEIWQAEYNITDYDNAETQLYIFNKKVFGNGKEDKNYLVYQIELYKDRPAYHKYYYIDAHTGELVYQIDGIQDAVHRHVWDCSAGYGYYDGYGTCYMSAHDSNYNYYVGRHEGDLATGSNPYPWTTQKTETDNLYTLFGQMHAYYETKFARNGANNLGGIGDGSGIYPSESTTGLTYIDWYYASPDSEWQICPNAFFNGTNSIHFCEGEISADLIGHEYGHALNYFSVLDGTGAASGLAYSGESGALNEANSDIFGEALETYANGVACDWQHGTGTPGGISRSMSDPSSLTYDLGAGPVPYPESFNDTNYYCGTSDNSGVHINSSVVNHAAYLMSQGGTEKNCSITGIGQEKTEQIFYRTETVYYTTTTTFNQAYTAIIQACADLYGGAESTDCMNVMKALKVTEMDGTGKCAGGIAATDLSAVCSDAALSAPTITSISSDTDDGFYKAGSIIDIDVTFSKAVTSAGVTVTLETGDTDATCSFAISNTTTGTCDYTVLDNNNSADLDVISVSGTIVDSDNLPLTNTTPTTSLAVNKNIIIDTEKPVASHFVKVYSSKKKKRLIKSVNTNTYDKILKDVSYVPYFTWKAATDNISGIAGYYIRFSNKKQKRLAVKKNLYFTAHRYLKGEVWDVAKTHYLQMIVKDNAGNVSSLKNLLRYQVIE